MSRKYKLSKKMYFFITIPVVGILLPVCVTPLFFLRELKEGFWLEFLPMFILSALMFLLVYRLSKFFFAGYVFEISDTGLQFSDGSTPIKFEQISNVEKRADSFAFARHISFELKPEFRKVRFQHFPILNSLGNKSAYISFQYIQGGKSSFHQFYDEFFETYRSFTNYQ